MNAIKIISFDLEGTLATLDFSQAIWQEGIPSLYSEHNNISFEKALAIVNKRYQEVGDKRVEWYDIKYWFKVFNLDGYQEILNKYKDRVSIYPDVIPVISTLKRKYKLIIATSSAREFLPYLLQGIEKYFITAVSSISDYSLIKCPQFYIRLSQEMGVQVDEIAHIGDSREFDLIAARSAGLKAFHLNRSQKSNYFSSISKLTDLEDRL